MKLNKKECRSYAVPELKFAKNNGLLYAEQIKHIIRTGIKNIAGQRVLLLYIYTKEQLADGNLIPLWTVFQSRDAYMTLAHREDGTTHWREASFDNLSRDYYFRSRCAFYSLEDEKRVVRFCKGKKGGLRSLNDLQDKLMKKRSLERQKKKEREIINRMNGLPPLPRDLKGWIQREVAPAYLFYDYHKTKKPVIAFCTGCGHEVSITAPKHNEKLICPHCKHMATMKSRGKRGTIFDEDTCQVVQTVGTHELVIRIIKISYTYPKKEDAAKKSVWENARLFLHWENGECPQAEPYYYSYNGGVLTNWKKGERPVFSYWNRNFEADLCGHVYCRNLAEALKNTPWQYCPLQQFYEWFHEPMELPPFLAAYIGHPKLEHLIKTGFYSLASDMAYRRCSCPLDETQNRTHRLLGVGAEDIPFLQSKDVNTSWLKNFQELCKQQLKDRQKLLDWEMEHELINHQVHILEILRATTVHKMTRYLEKQHLLLRGFLSPFGVTRYKDFAAVVAEYRDYLEMCRKQKYDMTNSFVLFPENLQKSHDKVQHSIELKENAKQRRAFRLAYKRIMSSLDYEKYGLKIVYPETPEEIVQEGNALHHCVGSYVERVAAKECIIVFLRAVNDPEKPFYTIEVRQSRITQIRGMGNQGATPEVDKFIMHWEREVLQKTAALPAAA